MNGWIAVSKGLRQTAARVARARRWHAGVATDVLSSLGNFTATISVARTADVSGLGMYAVAFAIYVLVTGTTCATVSESVISAPGWQSKFQPAGSRIMVLAGLSGCAAVAAGLAVGSPYLLIIGLALPGLAIYDHVKVMSVSVWQPSIALRQEAIWTGVSMLAVCATFLRDLQPTVMFAVWAGTGATLGLANALRHGIHVMPGWQGSWTTHRAATGYGVDYLAGHGVAQVVPLALAAVSGPSVVGALRGGGTMLSPISALTSPVRSLIIPRMVADSKRGAADYIRLGVSMTGMLAALVVVLGSVVLLIPDQVGRLMLGSNWAHAEPLIPALLVELVFIVSSTVPMAGHRVAQAARRTLSIHLGGAPIRLIAVIGASILGGPGAVAWAMAAISMSFCAVWWISFVQLARSREPRDAGS